MPLTILAATQTGSLVETAGVVSGVADVSASFTTGIMNEVMSPLTGGKTFTTGAGKLVGTLTNAFIWNFPLRLIFNKLGKDPWGAVGSPPIKVT